jgi:hypothetical protein
MTRRRNHRNGNGGRRASGDPRGSHGAQRRPDPSSSVVSGCRVPWKLPPELGLTVPANIVVAMEDPDWWSPWFEAGDWAPWKACLKAIFGLPLSGSEFSIFRDHTGRDAAPSSQMKEVWAICGRRAGKTRIVSLIAAWLSVFCDWRPFMSPGERASILILAQDRRGARTAMQYLRSLIVDHGLLRQLVTRQTDDLIELSCGTRIEVQAANWRSVRGYSCSAILCDEISFWLWAKDGPLLVWRGATRSMNTTVPEAIVQDAIERDPYEAAAEWLGEFRSDVSAFIDRALVEAAVDHGAIVRLPRPGTRYVSFTDPSGGQSDSSTCAIAHRDYGSGGIAVLDAVFGNKGAV